MERSKVDAMEEALVDIRDVCPIGLEGLSRETLCKEKAMEGNNKTNEKTEMVEVKL